MAIILAILGAVAGSQFNFLSQLNGFPPHPGRGKHSDHRGITALVPLLGAVLGAIAGMR